LNKDKKCTNSYVELKGYVEGKVPYVPPARIEINTFNLKVEDKMRGTNKLKRGAEGQADHAYCSYPTFEL
jgi:hypothetical protein